MGGASGAGLDFVFRFLALGYFYIHIHIYIYRYIYIYLKNDAVSSIPGSVLLLPRSSSNAIWGLGAPGVTL
jgi:hypothetical protein